MCAPLSAFCLYELSKLSEGLPVVLSALKQAGLAQVSIDTFTNGILDIVINAAFAAIKF